MLTRAFYETKLRDYFFLCCFPGSIRERCQAGLRCCGLPREELVWQTPLEVIIGDRSTIYGLNLLRIMFLLSIWTLPEITGRERHANITWFVSAGNWHSDRYETASRPAYWKNLLTSNSNYVISHWVCLTFPI